MDEWPHITTKADYARFEQAYAEGTAGYEIVTTAWDGEGDEHYKDNHCEFTWAPCEICRRRVGGSRRKMALLSDEDLGVERWACLDCQYYAEYGRLDDLTMLNLEG